MKCIVIGGSGFLGGFIIDYLLEKGDDVISADRTGNDRTDIECIDMDVLDFEAIKKVVKGADEVYRLAGMLGTSELNELIGQAIDVNIKGSVNVFEACKQEGVQRLFYPSKPNVWLNTYTVTKECSERFAELYNADTDLDIIRLRYFNAYGANQHTHPIRKIVPTFAMLARYNIPINIFGSGDNIVDMVDGRDLGKWTVEATRNNFNDRIYDLARGVPLTVKQVANDVNTCAGSTAGLSFSPMRSGEVEDTVLVADMDPFRKKLADVGQTLEFLPWMESLQEACDFYANIPDSVAKEALTYHKLM